MAGTLEQLSAEILSVYLSPGETPPAIENRRQPSYSILAEPPAVDAGDEKTIATVMELLRAVVAVAERTSSLPPPPSNAIYGVVAGAELVMRWECLAGRSQEVSGLLPGFAYLMTAFYLGPELALRRSNEVRELVEAAGFEPR